MSKTGDFIKETRRIQVSVRLQRHLRVLDDLRVIHERINSINSHLTPEKSRKNAEGNPQLANLHRLLFCTMRAERAYQQSVDKLKDDYAKLGADPNYKPRKPRTPRNAAARNPAQ